MSKMVAYFYNCNLFAILFLCKFSSIFFSSNFCLPIQKWRGREREWEPTAHFESSFHLTHLAVCSNIFQPFPLLVEISIALPVLFSGLQTAVQTINTQCLPLNLNLIVIGTWGQNIEKPNHIRFRVCN